MPRFLLSSLAMRDAPGRYRLHSRAYSLLMRLFAVMLAINIYRVVESDVGARAQRGVAGALLEATLHIVLLVLLVLMLWSRPKVVIATSQGLELGSGKKLRLIPWQQVADVREMPWMRFSTPWHPKLFQVDLAGGEAFDFVGARNSRQIVIGFLKRQESSTTP
jgi:hypothetical protein